MENIAILILLLSLIGLTVGLINPKTFKGVFKERANRKFISILFITTTVISFVMFGISTDSKSSKTVSEIKKVDSTTITKSPEEVIKAEIKKTFDGNNNRDKPYLRDINITFDSSKNASIIVNYNADENVTNNLTKVSIKSKMSELYYKLYEGKLPIKSVSICAYFTLVDKYGNNNDDIIYTTNLTKDEASKINWSNDKNTIETVIIPKIWTTNFIHPALNEE